LQLISPIFFFFFSLLVSGEADNQISRKGQAGQDGLYQQACPGTQHSSGRGEWARGTAPCYAAAPVARFCLTRTSGLSPLAPQTPESMMQRLLDRIEGFGVAESTTFRTWCCFPF
jgi:hypothetical protein